MSNIGNWTYTHPLTFWKPDFDIYGQPFYTKQYELLCAFKQESALRADGGVPTSEASAGADLYYFEYLGADPPVAGWVVALGSFDGFPPDNAKKIVTCTVYDVAMFGEAIPDYQASVI